MKRVTVIAGEASGDLHGANLIRSLRKLSAHPLDIHGVGGDRILQEGVRDFLDLAHCHVTGITEIAKHLAFYHRAAHSILESVRRNRPQAVVLIDNPGFNLHLAGKISALGIPVVYYIAPQLWAWAPQRIKRMKRSVSKVLVVFEFEKKIYEGHGIPVRWVGHPLKDILQNAYPPIEDASRARAVTLLPGSRKEELRRLFSVYLRAVEILSRRVPGLEFSVIKAPTLPREAYEAPLRRSAVPVRIVEDNAYESIRQSALALVCSGTATLECALLGTPLLICYKGSFLTYLAAKRVIRVPWLGLPNLVLGECRFPELLQYDATPEKIAAEADRLLCSPDAMQAMKKNLAEVSQKLGQPGASDRAAREILEIIQ